MSHIPTEPCSGDASLDSTSNTYKFCTTESNSRHRRAMPTGPHVLVIEFRDEVYAGLKAVLEEHGCYVARVEIGAAMPDLLSRFKPDLVLVNETMPDESGWLIACKLGLTRPRQPVWLYAVQRPRSTDVQKEISGVDQVVEYGGVLLRLVQHVGQRLVEWMGDPADEPLMSASTYSQKWIARLVG